MLDTPSLSLANSYLSYFDENKRYGVAERAIAKLFNLIPENKIVEDVLLKLSVVNDLYSTNIFSSYKLAEHIVNVDIDDRIEKGDLLLVNDIARNHGIINSKTDKERCFYSFATKYCSWYNDKDYAIYDSFVEKVLMHFNRESNFTSFKKSELKDYSRFMEVIMAFARYYKIDSLNLKTIDQFLWVYGKKHFKSQYS